MVQRFWIYQRERFPFLIEGALIAVISISGVSFSILARHYAEPVVQPSLLWSLPAGISALVAFVSTLGFFFQLWAADEGKPYADEVNLRAYRPTPRGLVSLRKLRMLALALMFAQLALAVWLNAQLSLPLLLVWGYIGLMHKEFFIDKWLKTQPLLHMLSHMVITPLIFLYITACDWLAVKAAPPAGLLWFLVVGFFSGMIFEIGRKIRAPQDEETGVETYSKLWGRRTAVTVWFLVTALAGIFATVAARPLKSSVPIFALAIILMTCVVLIGERFLQNPITVHAGWIEKFSALCLLLLCLSLGVMPLFIL